jgi:type IV pilus assembly protein PilO
MDFQKITEQINEFDFNNIDWNNMGSWPLAGRVFFGFLLFFGVIVGLYFLDIKESMERYDRIVAEEGVIKQDFETKAFRVANLDAYKKQLAEIEESFGSLLRQLPRDTEVPGLLEDITNSAIGANLDIRSIKLDKEKETEFYTELPINIDVTGEYHDFGAFVSAVAGLGRIVTLHDFTVIPVDKQNNKQLNLKIVAKTYRYNDEAKKPSKKKKAKR